MKNGLDFPFFQEIRSNAFVLLSLILLAVGIRVILPSFLGHIPNFSPMDAIALFSGAYFRNRGMAFLITGLTVFLSDLLIGHIFYPGFYAVYIAYAAIVF